MATSIIMPALGMAQEYGILTAWLKNEGEEVSEGEPLMEIETDKTTVEVEAPASGILAGVSAWPGDQVPVAQIIAWLLEPGESLPSEAESKTLVAAQPESLSTLVNAFRGDSPTVSPVAARIAAAHDIDLGQLAGSGERITKADVLAYIEARGVSQVDGEPVRRQPASPKARRLAQELGLQISEIQGSGPDEAVLAADVLAMEAAEAHSKAVQERPGSAVSQAWRVMGERMAQSWTSVPHFFLTREVDVSRLVEWRQIAQGRSAEKVTFTDLLIKAAALALREHPRVNASWLDESIYINDAINIGLAVATEEGLIVPVIHEADGKSVAQLAAERKGIVERAVRNKLKLSDLQAGTFTISNLGMYGVDGFNAIINPPQAAILAVGRIADRVVPIDGRPAVRPMMMLTLSLDHRVVDGARGAEFLATVARYIEEPLEMI